MKTSRAVLLALVLVLASPAASHAAGSITYIKDREVWIANPDGSGARQVSHHATDRSAMRSPSQRNDGVIYAAGPDKFFYRFNADGSSAGAPLLAPTCGGLGYGPTNAQVHPKGGLVLYNYIFSDCFFPFDELHVRTTMVSDSAPVISESIFPHWKNVGTPRWLGETSIGMIELGGETIWFLPELPSQGGSAGTIYSWIGFGEAGQADFDSFDYHAATDNLLAEVTPNGSGADEKADLWVLNSEPKQGAAVNVVCSLAEFARKGAQPRWSPDGTQIVWTAGDGVYVSPAPVADGSGDCVLQPKLIAAGGSDASWGGTGDTPGPGDGKAPPADGGDGKPPANTDTGNNGNNGDGTIDPPADTAPPKLALTARGAKLRTTLGKGYVATVSCDEACTLDGRLLYGNKATSVASGSVKLAKAGKGKLKLKFTKQAKKALKGKRTVKLTLRIAGRDAAGNPATKTAAVTLKR